MTKHFSKAEKLQMLEKVKDLGCNAAAKILNLSIFKIINIIILKNWKDVDFL